MKKQNLDTRYAIINGLNQLSKTIPYDKIRIMDICKASGVSRATFYRLFYNIDDIVYWLWDECNSNSLYKMGNPYGWKTAKIMQFNEMLKYKDLFINAFTESKFSFITGYGQERILDELSNTIKSVYHYEMTEQEYLELEYFTYGGCYMFTKWVGNGMQESPEVMAGIFGNLILQFVKDLFGE